MPRKTTRNPRPKHPLLASACRLIEPLEPRTLLAFSPIGSEFRVNTHTNGAQSNAAMAMDADGDFVIAWESQNQNFGDWDVYAQRYNAAGQPQGAEFLVNTFTMGGRRSPAVAMDADGDFLIAWTGVGGSSDLPGVYARRYNAAGIPQGSESRICPTMGPFALAMNANGDFVSVWAGGDIYAQRYNAAGIPQDAEFRVNTYTPDSQTAPTVDMDAAGNFVIAWESNGQDGSQEGIYAQRFNAAAQPLGAEFRANTFTPNWQRAPALAMSDRGGFVITWHSYGQESGTLANTDVYAQRYDADGIPQGSEFRVNIGTDGSQDYPAIAMDAAGNFVVAWQHQSGIWARRYDSVGLPLNNVFRADSTSGDYKQNPSIAMDADGDFLIAWTSYNQDGSEGGIYAQRYAQVSDPAAIGDIVWNDLNTNGVQDAGEPGLADAVVKLYSAAGSLLFTRTTTTSGAFRFDNVPAGDYYLEFTPPSGWVLADRDQSTDDSLDSDPDPITGRTALFSVQPGQTDLTRDAGLVPAASISGAVYDDLDANGVRDAGDPLVPGGTIYIDANANGQYDGGERSVLIAPDGGYTLSNLRAGVYQLGIKASILARPIPSDDAPLSVSLHLGQNRTGIDFAVQRIVLPAPQLPSGAEFRANTNTSSSQIYPAVAMDADGDFVVAWEGRGQNSIGYDIYAQRYNAAGQPQGAQFRANTYTTYDQRKPSLAMDASGNFVIAWESFWQEGPGDGGYGVYAQRYNAAGVPQGPEFHVNTYTSSDQRYPTLAMDADGDFVIAWQSGHWGFANQDGSDYGIYAQRYNAAGQPQGSEFRVNSTTAYGQMNPALAMNASGSFIIAWESENNGFETNIYAQRYNANGTPQGGEFRVNSYTTAYQRSPALALHADGSFVIAWDTDSQGDIGTDIHAQRYNPAGVPQGSEFRVNSYTGNSQRYPTLAMDADGDLVIAWQSWGQDGSSEGIYAQRYNSAGVPQSGEFRVNSYTGNDQCYPTLAMDADGDLVIAWQSWGQDGSWEGIYAQRYQHGYANPILTTTTLPDTLRLARSGDNLTLSLDGVSPSPLYRYPLNSSLPLTLSTLAGDDRLILDFSTGNPIPPSGLTFTGGDGNDSLLFTTSTTYASFTTPLDLANNTLLISNATLPQVQAWLRSNLLFTSLKTQYTTLAPFPQPDGSILVKLTYYGDTNNDGQVNLTDYFTIDSGYLNQRQGFTNGDANLDGEINLNDYFLIDSAYLNQQAPLSPSSFIIQHSSFPSSSPSSLRRSVASSLSSKQVLKTPKKKPKTKPTFSSKKRIR